MSAADEDTLPNLPAWKAFVVQLTRDTTVDSGIMSGRIEHLSSGQRARFSSGRELLAVLTRMLGGIEEDLK